MTSKIKMMEGNMRNKIKFCRNEVFNGVGRMIENISNRLQCPFPG